MSVSGLVLGLSVRVVNFVAKQIIYYNSELKYVDAKAMYACVNKSHVCA